VNESDIFISYSHHDGASYARSLGEDLTRRGFRVWLDDVILRTGDDLLNKIVPAIRAAGLYVPIITPQFCDENRWAYKEFLEALKEEVQRKQAERQETFIFPILHNIASIDDSVLNRNSDLKNQVSNRLCANSRAIDVVTQGIVKATGIVEDVFVPTATSTLEVGRFPVTNLEFRRFIIAGGYTNTGINTWWSEAGKELWLAYARRENHKYLRSIRTEDSVIDTNLTASNSHYNRFNQPVTGVCYFEAEAYCNWLSNRSDQNQDWRIRLPTEQEWISFLNKTVGQFPWGLGPPEQGKVNIIFDKLIEDREGAVDLIELSKIRYPNIYGEYPEGASYIGCHDLIGNIWEWTSDFESNQSTAEKSEEGNIAKIMGNCCFDYPSRIKFPPKALRYPGYRHHVIGFRVVREFARHHQQSVSWQQNSA